MAELNREAMLAELLEDCNEFIRSSASWRKNSFEAQWRRWQRNADSIIDPAISAKKEPWQSQAFVPVTASHRENAQAQLFKTEVGPRPALEIKRRFDSGGQEDQSQNVRDMILLEREKSRYELERNKVLEDKTTYGSGFARIRFESRFSDRVMRMPMYEEFDAFNPATYRRFLGGQPQIVGYEAVVQQVQIYRGIRFEHISIWDVYPDPKALQIRGNQIAHRYFTTYGEIVDGVESGYYLPEAKEKLKDLQSAEQTPESAKEVEADRGIASSETERTEYAHRLECYERQAMLPKKWIYINGEEIDDPEKLVPARVRFHAMTIVGVELNDSYDGEPDIYKDDYMPVAGQFYGRGVPEMLKDVQLVCNAEVNQRLDCKTIKMSMDTMIAVIEKSVANPADLQRSVIGNIIRLKNPDGINDINQSFIKLDGGSIDRAAFIEPEYWERLAQERTSINRLTMGTHGQTTDANKTLGGMEMIRAAAGDKFAYLGMLSEFDFQYEVSRAYWRLIYSNYEPEDIVKALGPERAQQFILISPEQLENDYQYYPMGIYTMESRAIKQARLSEIRTQYAGAPWLNDIAFFDSMVQSGDDDPARYKLPDAEVMQLEAKAQQMAQLTIDKVLEEKKKVEQVEKLAEDIEKREVANSVVK